MRSDKVAVPAFCPRIRLRVKESAAAFSYSVKQLRRRWNTRIVPTLTTALLGHSQNSMCGPHLGDKRRRGRSLPFIDFKARLDDVDKLTQRLW